MLIDGFLLNLRSIGFSVCHTNKNIRLELLQFDIEHKLKLALKFYFS